MIEKASIYAMNALNKLSELWHTSVNCKARPVVEGEQDKSWNNHGLPVFCTIPFFVNFNFRNDNFHIFRSSGMGGVWGQKPRNPSVLQGLVLER